MLLDKINEVNDIKKLNKEEFGESRQRVWRIFSRIKAVANERFEYKDGELTRRS